MDYEKMSPADKKAYLEGRARFEKGIEEETRRQRLYERGLMEYQLLIEFTKAAMNVFPKPTEYMGSEQTELSYKDYAKKCLNLAKYVIDELNKHKP